MIPCPLYFCICVFVYLYLCICVFCSDRPAINNSQMLLKNHQWFHTRNTKKHYEHVLSRAIISQTLQFILTDPSTTKRIKYYVPPYFSNQTKSRPNKKMFSKSPSNKANLFIAMSSMITLWHMAPICWDKQIFPHQ